jgi:hypothetical protein
MGNPMEVVVVVVSLADFNRAYFSRMIALYYYTGPCNLVFYELRYFLLCDLCFWMLSGGRSGLRAFCTQSLYNYSSLWCYMIQRHCSF